MITVVDTNILIDLLGNDTGTASQSEMALDNCAQQGTLALPTVCYAELAPRFVSRRVLDGFLAGFTIVPTPLSLDAAFLAGKLFAEHVRRSGRKGRILPDFLVGAHAIVMADQLLTRDQRFYSESFRDLKVVSLPAVRNH